MIRCDVPGCDRPAAWQLALADDRTSCVHVCEECLETLSRIASKAVGKLTGGAP